MLTEAEGDLICCMVPASYYDDQRDKEHRQLAESAPSASTNTLRDAIALLVECHSKLVDIMGECDDAFNCNCLPMKVKRFIAAQQHP
jgi:hypothetical protein